jgi:hypothetical protein
MPKFPLAPAGDRQGKQADVKPNPKFKFQKYPGFVI